MSDVICLHCYIIYNSGIIVVYLSFNNCGLLHVLLHVMCNDILTISVFIYNSILL